MSSKSKTFEQILAKFVPNREPGSCWPWSGFISSLGYGQYRRLYKNYMAHRLIYEHLVGPIPQGLELDHTCKNRRCVNPSHLEPVTHLENIRRGRSYRRERTHCPPVSYTHLRAHETPEH